MLSDVEIVGSRDGPDFQHLVQMVSHLMIFKMGNLCPSNLMAIFSKNAFLPVSQKIKFAHYWISDRREMRPVFLEKSHRQVSYVLISGW